MVMKYFHLNQKKVFYFLYFTIPYPPGSLNILPLGFKVPVLSIHEVTEITFSSIKKFPKSKN